MRYGCSDRGLVRGGRSGGGFMRSGPMNGGPLNNGFLSGRSVSRGRSDGGLRSDGLGSGGCSGFMRSGCSGFMCTGCSGGRLLDGRCSSRRFMRSRCSGGRPVDEGLLNGRRSGGFMIGGFVFGGCSTGFRLRASEEVSIDDLYRGPGGDLRRGLGGRRRRGRLFEGLDPDTDPAGCEIGAGRIIPCRIARGGRDRLLLWLRTEIQRYLGQFAAHDKCMLAPFGPEPVYPGKAAQKSGLLPGASPPGRASGRALTRRLTASSVRPGD
jgi:hypothetical protein